MLFPSLLWAQVNTPKKKSTYHTTKVKDNDTAKTNNVILLPDFFHYNNIVLGDTTWSYECYGHNMHKISLYDITSTDEIDHVKYFKSYCPIPSKQGSGTVSVPYIYSIITKYVHPTPTTWLSVETGTNKIIHYKLIEKKIVRSEYVSQSDPKTKKEKSLLIKYYKTEKISGNKEK